MSKIGHNFPPSQALPIPEDVRPGPGWTERMLEMAEHIGAYRTLLLAQAFGGERIYIPADFRAGKVYPGRGSIREVVGDEAARILSDVYGREYFWFPTAKTALARARRAPVIASVRAGDISAADAARMVGISRTYIAHLLNETREGLADDELPARARRCPGQMDLFAED
jgi:hypothetical protein